jgi:peptidoglycan hydrolase-like protein with peptidoglycan-binding domain
MPHRPFRTFALLMLTVFLAAGCATTRPRQADQTDLSSQVAALQSELQAKDQQIQDLQYQLESYQQSLSAGSSGAGAGRSASIRVPGVSVSAVQKALVNAGLDPGPVDGRMGKKTKRAIKEFQRRNNLTADGIVGERTWSLLRS